MVHRVNSVAQLNEAIDAGATFADYIELEDGTNLTGANTSRELDFRIANGGHVTVNSFLPAWFVFDRDCSLTVVWDSVCALSFSGPYKGASASVRLVGWPEGGSEIRALREILGRDGITVLIGEDDAHRPCKRAAASDVQVSSPPHYVWLGEAMVANGAPENTKDLQSWDFLDALFPDSPHLWNAGKYLTRFGRKGDAGKRVEDLRKAATYLERAIKVEEQHAG